METFPANADGLNKSPSTSTNSSNRRSSRASSSPVERSRTRSGNSGNSTPPPRPRPRLMADVTPAPLSNSQPRAHVPHSPQDPKGLSVERPTLTRFYSSGATRHHAAQSPAILSRKSVQNPRKVSPSRLVNGTASTFLYPPRGDNKKRAASLDDLRLPAPIITSASSYSPPPFPLPTSIPVSSHSPDKTTNRASQYGKQRWHALMELVSTEESYVKDLKILVRIYLEQLPLVTALDSDAQTEIARNADALLLLHKKIYRRLNRIVVDERIKELKDQTSSAQAERKLADVINRVAAVFVKEASSFHLYESFCAGHSQALDLIRQVQGLPEWDMYEKRCAVIVVDELANGDATKSPEVYGNAATPKIEAVASPIMSRRHSTDVAPNLLPSLSRTSKLTMRDFLIMPIQRICRYPLMLRQLQLHAGLATPPASPTLTASVGAHTNPADAGIEAQALDAMKQVAAKVDEARRRTDVAIKTRLVIERISEQAMPQLSLLGDCLLAGSLDVVYHHEILAPLDPPIKVKYLGAFLYGGWILLVKVLKNKIYEPRHWFPLPSVYLTDIPEDDALLPASFRLSCGDHHFEFAAACSQEKAIWMKQIRFARTQSTLRSSELPSSLEEGTPKPPTPQGSARPLSMRPPSRKAINPLPISPATDNVVVNPPKRQSSMGALENDELMRLASASLAYIANTSPEMPPSPVMTNSSPTALTPVQMRNLLEGDVSTILIRRASTNHRRMVDQSLHDVFFEECQSVRVAAQMKTPLFQPPKLTSETGSLAARNKMTKRESVLLRRQRSVLDTTSIHSSGSTPRTSSPASKSPLSRNKSAGVVGSKDFRRRTLAIPSFSFFEEREEPKSGQRPNTADSPYSSLPGTPTMATHQDSEDHITFQTRRDKAKRASRLGSQLLGRTGGSDEETETIRTVQPMDPNALKELPPIPPIDRRSTFNSSTSRISDDRTRFSLLVPKRRSVDRRYSSGTQPSSVYAVGEGLSNVWPEQTSGGSLSRLNPGAFIRRSLTIIASKRPKSGYVTSLFNRSTTNVARGGDGDSSNAHTTRSEPPTQMKRLSASTPALQPRFQEPLSDWEVLPNSNLHQQFDAKLTASESFIVPPLPPLPRHAHTLRSKTTLRRRSSQMFQHLSTFTHTSNRDS